MTTLDIDAGMAGIVHPRRHAHMGRPDLPLGSRPGAFLAEIVAAKAMTGAFDYRGATAAEMERGSMPVAEAHAPALGREQARWLEADDDPGHEVRR